MKKKTEPAKRADLPELSRLELDIMAIVWELGECSSAEVIAAYARKRRLAETTIRTVLTNLRKKGYLEPVPTIERGFRLRPLVSRESVARRSIKTLVTGLFNGSPRQMISWLLKDEEVSEADLEEIRRMIAESKTSKKGGQDQ